MLSRVLKKKSRKSRGLCSRCGAPPRTTRKSGEAKIVGRHVKWVHGSREIVGKGGDGRTYKIVPDVRRTRSSKPQIVWALKDGSGRTLGLCVSTGECMSLADTLEGDRRFTRSV